MNAFAALPCACAGHSGAAAGGEPAKAAGASFSSSALRSLFLLLLGDLMQPELGQNEEAAKKQEPTSQQASSLAVPGAVPVPLPMPADPPMAKALPTFGEAQAGADDPPVTSSPERPAPVPNSIADYPVAGAPLPSSGTFGFPNIPSPPADAGLPAIPDPSLASQAAEGLAVSNRDLAAAMPGSPVARMSPAQPLEPLFLAVALPRPPGESLWQTSPADVNAASQPYGRQLDPEPKPDQTQSKTLHAAAAPESVQSTAFRDAVIGSPEVEPEHPPEPEAGSIPVQRGASLLAPALAQPAERPALPARAEAIAELAFVARLVPVAKEPAHTSGLNQQAGLNAQAPGAPVRADACISPPSERKGRDTDSRAAGAPLPAVHAPAGTPAESEPQWRDDPPASRGQVQPSVTLAVAARDTVMAVPQPRPALAAEPHRTPAPPSGPPPASPLPARDIRLQASGGEQRVDVRLSERGGQIQVAVRTPDARLTEALRSDLPALSARLEQSGFRAETWHPAAHRTEHFTAAPEPPSPGSSPHGQAGGRQGAPQDREPPPRRAPAPGPKTPPDHSPREFSWLFASLR